jgi:phosphomannomutase
VTRGDFFLGKLATRDAILPILSVLSASASAGVSLTDLFDQLPKRFSRAALLKQFPRPVSMKIVDRFGPSNPDAMPQLAAHFSPALALPPVKSMDYTDGVRATLENGEVIHIRPSGNADELRIYAVADSQHRANALCAEGVAEPNGFLRRLEAFVGE